MHDLKEGAVLAGRYRIETLLGEGGMGRVYRARDTSLQRNVALKVIAPEYLADPEMRARFLREARAAASIVHPNVVTIFDVFGEQDNEPAFIVMELVNGTPFRTALLQPNISTDRRVGWLLGLARGLDALHRKGYVHRDVKPANVIIAASGDRAKLLDLGIARPIEGDAVDAYATTTTIDIAFRTQTGTALGTPRYMAPEQARGEPIDPRVDQFAWGLVAYEVFSLTAPSAHTPDFAAAADFAGTPRPLDVVVPQLPSGIAPIVMKCLARSPDDRFPNMAAVIAELERAAPTKKGAPPQAPTPPPPPRRTHRRLFLLSVAVVMGVGLALLGALFAVSKITHPVLLDDAGAEGGDATAPVTLIVIEDDVSSAAEPLEPPIVVVADDAKPSAKSPPALPPQVNVRGIRSAVTMTTTVEHDDARAWREKMHNELVPCFQLITTMECTNRWTIDYTVENGDAMYPKIHGPILYTPAAQARHPKGCESAKEIKSCILRAFDKHHLITTKLRVDGSVFIGYGTFEVMPVL